MLRPLHALTWDNRFARLPKAFGERVLPTPIPDPWLVAFNRDVAALLDLAPSAAADPDFLAWIAGNLTLPGTDPVAAIYAGHQFGVWVPQLGDGRAILLGEVTSGNHRHWDVQLKGAGMTRFSRMGDGRAVLRSTIREYLAGEAMHGLGIPTTRALAIAASDTPVYRERAETAAVLVRVAPSHVRFGSFQLFASRKQADEVRLLADHVIEHHFPACLALPAQDRYAAWYREIVDRTARLIAEWTAVGFAHGVMNTDNMSILGLTLDYGPYAFLDRYDPGFICNHSDPSGRYAFDQQPRIGLWNCARLGEALFPLVAQDSALAALESYRDTFESTMDGLVRAKLGLARRLDGDAALVGDLFDLMHRAGADYTRAFRLLSSVDASEPETARALREEIAAPALLDPWLSRWLARVSEESVPAARRRAAMAAINPKYVLRNWIAQEVIEAAEARDTAPLEAVMELLRAPYDEHPGMERYAAGPPAGMVEVAVSCSS
jgi:uncharacterized protein YdiU (UPF0061 family)